MSQNSHFQFLIFHNIHNFKISFFTKFTFSMPHFSQNSYFQSLIFHKMHNFKVSFSTKFTGGVLSNFILLLLENKFFIQKLPRIWCLKNVNFVKNKTLKLWILWKMRLWNCEFCQKWDFENMNFVKNEIFKMLIFG